MNWRRHIQPFDCWCFGIAVGVCAFSVTAVRLGIVWVARAGDQRLWTEV